MGSILRGDVVVIERNGCKTFINEIYMISQGHRSGLYNLGVLECRSRWYYVKADDLTITCAECGFQRRAYTTITWD